MRSLFWKMFLAFWLTQALILALTVVIVNLGFGRVQLRNVDQLRAFMPTVAQDAVQTFESGGSQELNHYFDSQTESASARFWLFDSGGNELSGNPYTASVAGAVRAGSTIANAPQGPVVTLPIGGEKGSYTFAAQIRPHRGIPPTRVLVRQLLIGVVIAGIVCLLLAHSLTRPIVRLRETAQELAVGNLTARAGAVVVNRPDEIGELGRDFDRMAGQIENLVESQKQLLRDISHDLRSPLQRLRMAVELARRGDSSQPAQLDRIEREAVRINSFIEQLLTLAKLESTETVPEMETVSLNAIAEQVIGDVKFEAERAACAITLTALTSYFVRGNAQALQSAIENVVRNAIHHGGDGKSIEIGLHAEGEDAVLSVRDHGPGVPEEALPRLFEPFYRVDRSRGSRTGGTGLGLAIAAKAIALHGGTIRAHNVAPEGLAVTMRIPQERGAVTTVAASS